MCGTGPPVSPVVDAVEKFNQIYLVEYYTHMPSAKSVQLRYHKGKRVSKSKPSRRQYKSEKKETELISSDALADLRSLATLKEKVEYKVPIPQFRGSEAPTSLSHPHPGYVLRETKESTILKTALSRMFSNRIYNFRVTTALNVSSNGTGIVNSIIGMSTIQSTPDFVALSGVFNEFFIKTCDVKYEPVSMYNYPLTGIPSTSVSSLPLGVADLQHSQAAYTNLSNMTENWRYEHNNTGRPFRFRWQNVEKAKSTVTSADAVSGGFTQNWCLCTDAASYTGTIQFLTQSAPPALPTSQVLGTFLVEWNVLFRVRL